jgi:oxygen-dependent protoporphyrinogen oxidase
LDKYLPARIGASAEVTSVSALVRARMGRRVLERLVAPVVGGVHSADPDLLDVDMVAPGLRTGIKAHRSLAAAVAAQRRSAGGPSAAKAGSAVAGLENGMHTLVTALLNDLQERGVTLLTGSAASAVERTADGWRVTAGEVTYDGGLLVVALPGPAAVGLLQEAVPALAGRSPEPGPDVRLVTLVVDLPELDRRPRGTGVLVAPQTPGIQAKALTHATAKWDWLAAAAGPGTHVLRLSYGRLEGTPEEGSPAPDSAPVTDTALLAAALRDASALLDVPVQGKDVVGWDVVRWQGALPFAAVGHKARVAGIRAICAAENGLSVVGGWVAGNGLAAVVFDTRKEIRSLVS